MVRLLEFKRPISLKLLYKTIIALENEKNKDLMYKFYIADLIKGIATAQGIEVKKTFADIYNEMQEPRYDNVETSEEIIEKTCNLFRAFNKKE